MKHTHLVFCAFYLLIVVFSESSFAKGNEVIAANHAVELDSLYCKPEVFLVKVTEVNSEYNYCKGLIDNAVCYIEPLSTDTVSSSNDFMPLRAGEYYMMALVYSNPEIIWWLDSTHQVNSYNMMVAEAKGKWRDEHDDKRSPDNNIFSRSWGNYISEYDVMTMAPDTFIAVNLDGCSIRPIEPDDLISRPQWPEFVFHSGIPSFESLCKAFQYGKDYPQNYPIGVNVLSRVKNVGDFSAYFHSGYREYIESDFRKTSCPPADFPHPNGALELPKLKRPSCLSDSITKQSDF